MCRSCGTELGFGVPCPQPDSIPSIQMRVWDSEQDVFGCVHPPVLGVEITEVSLAVSLTPAAR